MPPSNQNQTWETEAEGFEKVGNKQRASKRKHAPENPPKHQQANRYEALNLIMEEGEGSEVKKTPKEIPNEEIQKENMEQKHKEIASQPLGDTKLMTKEMELVS